MAFPVPTHFLALCLCTFSFTACGEKVYLDPAEAGRDYRLQGEYTGTAIPEDGDPEQARAMGAQVIALGEGKFEAVIYEGGLPGEGRQGDVPPVRVEGRAKGKKGPAEFKNNEMNLSTDGQMLRGTLPGGLTLEAHKVVRKSPTLGEAPPADALVLFNGDHTDAWQRAAVDDQGRMVTNLSGKKDFRTKKDFRGLQLHLEFMTPFKPEARGQGRGNSGVFLPGAWEVQILDSFGLSGEHNECGGLYKEKAPDLNMAYPPLTWQTYDITYHAGKQESPDGEVLEPTRITVLHNGVIIHDNVELEPIRPGRAKSVEGPIMLQDHGNPVFFRNIWVQELAD
jgi:hypothetical protein